MIFGIFKNYLVFFFLRIINQNQKDKNIINIKGIERDRSSLVSIKEFELFKGMNLEIL